MAKQQEATTSGPDPRLARRLRESGLFMLLTIAVYLLVCLASYHATDPGWSGSGQTSRVQNVGGMAGAWLADFGLFLFGYLAYLFPLMLGFAGWLVYRGPAERDHGWAEALTRLAGFVLTLGAGAGLAQLHFEAAPNALPLTSGGILGDLVATGLAGVAGMLGATLFLLGLFLAGITLFTGLSWLGLMDAVGRLTLDTLVWLRDAQDRFKDWWAGRKARARREEQRRTHTERKKGSAPPRIEPAMPRLQASKRVDKERQRPLFEGLPGGSLPPLSLLDEPLARERGYSQEVLEALSRQVELKLADFGIEVEVVAVHPGPVITRFELQPAPGVKGSQVAGLAKDLARGLSVTSVRVVDVIPGKSVIGLEIPNENRELVYLSEILRSREYDQAASSLSLALGKDIGGHPVVVDLQKMPHLLVAGTTGSGKSVALNAMILSLLYKASPEQVRMIMVDPKMLELSIYEGIPHLLAPVVTDMKEAANALRWCVAEMERRYRLMATLGVRNLAGFNRKVKEANDHKQPIPDPFWERAEGVTDAPPPLEPLPYIVVVVDEFADMMMMVGKKVEELIARLAQKARASGIHLVLATQRPSVDVITGLIKANIPTRIAFQVSSKVDSRTILDQTGAEALLGHGDMLYLPPGSGTPERVHGAFVADHEVHKVVENLKQQGEPEYLDGVLEDAQFVGDQQISDNGLPQAPSSDVDALYDEAVRIVTETRRASISGVQRRLKIGYNRAARMLEDMEAAGIVSELQPNGSREVLAPPPPKD